MMKKMLVMALAMVLCSGVVLAAGDMQSSVKASETNNPGMPVACPPPCQHQGVGDDCSLPILLSGTTWSGNFDLCGYCDDYDLQPCTGYASDARDMVFEVNFHQSGCFLNVMVTPTSSWDIALAVIADCGNFSGTSCLDGEDDNGAGIPEAAQLTNLPAGAYYIVVSGYMSECGSFDIVVTSDCELPVELVSFDGVAGDGRATLTWVTASETNNDHFYLIRGTDQESYVRTSVDIPATNSSSGASYTWVDRGVINGTTYYYKLVDVDINGLENVNDMIAEVTPSAAGNMVPDAYALHQNFPNPFNPNTTIMYDVKEAGFVSLAVFDILGREIMTLVNDQHNAGRYLVEFDASALASGIYFYQLKVNGFADLKKMVVLK